ncbi:hypothetical protein [Aliivibrio salmonicida]|uniref:hypothetical protein n=1 Tax=Aliivibrio salmonicida TaxID=40269 RepID=UPI003D11FCD9
MARAIVGEAVNKMIETSTSTSTFDYGVKKIPKLAKDKFNKLKSEGKVTGSMNAYIVRALMTQLRIDEHNI